MVLPRITTDYHGNTTFACGNGKHVVMGPAVWYGNGIHGITITMVIYHGKKYGIPPLHYTSEAVVIILLIHAGMITR